MEEGRKKEEGRESKTLKLCFKGGFELFACLHFLSICTMGGLPCLAFFLKLLAIKVDFRIYTLNGFFQDGFLQLTFPNDDDRPAFCLQLSPDLLVALLVAGDFGGPEVSVGFGRSCVLAVLVSVPEAPVDKDDRAVFGKDEVGGAGETLVVNPVPEPHVPEGVTQGQLRLR